MLPPKEQFSELLTLTQLYLTREFSIQDKAIVDKQAYRDLKKHLSSAPTAIIKKSEPLLEPIKLPVKDAAPVIQAQVVAPIKTNLNPSKTPFVEHAPSPSPSPVVQEKKQFILDTSSAPIENTIDLSYKEIFKTHFPNLQVLDTIPNDHIAKREKDLWQAKQQILPVSILAFHEDHAALILLKNIAKAITLRFTPAKVVNGIELEKEQQWETFLSNQELRFVISGDYGLYLQPNLMKHYHQDPKTGTHYLSKTPLLLLSDISLYLKKPELKALLWNAICNQLGS